MLTRPALMDVVQDEIEDLRRRLRHTRWPTSWLDAPAWPGPGSDELRRLLDHWAGLRLASLREAAHALPWHQTEIQGQVIPFLRYGGETDDALPIVLTCGWPSSCLELTALAERLAAPSRRAEPSHEVLVVGCRLSDHA